MERPDCNNVEELKKFFDEYKDYTTFEISLKTKIPSDVLRRWRVKAGIKSVTEQSEFFRAHRNHKKVEIVKVTDPAIWDNKEWFVEAYSKYGIIKIAKIIDKASRTVVKRLKKYDIKTKSWSESVKSKNPCNNVTWIVDQYYYQKIGIRKMSKLANVSVYTIYDWLVSFNIYPRTRHKASALKRWRILKIRRIMTIDKYNKIHGTSIQSFKEIPRFRPEG